MARARPARGMIPAVVSSPWAAFAGEDGVPLNRERCSIPAGAVLPRLIGEVPAGSVWNGSAPVASSGPLQDKGIQWDFPLPVSGEQAGSVFRHAHGQCLVTIQGLSPRAAEADRDSAQREQWLTWQLQRYAELADFGEADHRPGDEIESRLPSGARRSWHSVQRFWRLGGDEAAELALIVRLAQDDRLMSSLRSIEKGPRRMLLRQHEPVKIARIQEMDAGTLRAYSQAPGRNAVQKAGAKQELLAVVRRDTVDLVENRLVLWVARRMMRMAEVYCQSNANFSHSGRFQRVRRLYVLCKAVVSSPRFDEVKGLPHHLTAPTYCLQFESRYRHLWKAYQTIRRQDRLEDDAWQWQTRFWGTSARLILGSMLMCLDDWGEPHASTPFINNEGICGQWLFGPSTPGPLVSPFGACQILDLREGTGQAVAIRAGLPEDALQSGADWVLAWPNERRLLLVWTAVGTGVVDTGVANLGLNRVSSRMIELASLTGWGWGGIALVAEPERSSSELELIDSLDNVAVLRIPADVHACWGDVQAGVQLALEELHRG